MIRFCFCILFLLLVSNVSVLAEGKVNKLFLNPHNSVKVIPGYIYSVERYGDKIVNFTVKFSNKDETYSCTDVTIYSFHFRGDRIDKKRHSCNDLFKGMKVEVVFYGTKAKELRIMPHLEKNL